MCGVVRFDRVELEIRVVDVDDDGESGGRTGVNL
jgi:hypothetical protein